MTGTSIKVHHQPGGASSFSLGGGYGGEGSVLDKPKSTGAVAGAANAAANSTKEDEEKKIEETNNAGAAAATGGSGAVGDIRRVQAGTASVTDAFGNKVSGTSVKVHAPPGGYSSIQF